jgi:virulence factor Mce-like protein
VIRIAFITLVLAGTAAATVASMGAGEDRDKRYRVELDNAFGLVDGADVKVAGVRAGKIAGFEIDPKSYRALVDIEIDQGGFGDLRADVFCESRPQSLIGEYFLDCKPGTSRRKLPDGARIPVEQTASTISVDLVNNIMRRPYRERFSIILGELGAALAARGTDLNETIRRANPALRETDKVLAILADQRRIIADLTTNADRVVTRLADKRTEVTRFIIEARDTARASAERRTDLRAQLQRFPTFLRELRPTMARLGEAADRQTPALRNLSDAAPLLRRFFDDLGPFSEASRPAFRSLAKAADTGRDTIPVARPQIRQLGEFAEPLPELTSNLAITLEHLDDRKFAIEKDPRSPGGQGFTGFEAILSYVFRQSQATNVFDDNSYLLKVSAFLDELCAQYTDAEQAKDRERDRCLAALGPGRPGIDEPVAASSAKPARSARATRAPPAAAEPQPSPALDYLLAP